jgi:polyhydroxyalkanoate synthesis regulator phasin
MELDLIELILKSMRKDYMIKENDLNKQQKRFMDEIDYKIKNETYEKYSITDLIRMNELKAELNMLKHYIALIENQLSFRE